MSLLSSHYGCSKSWSNEESREDSKMSSYVLSSFILKYYCLTYRFHIQINNLFILFPKMSKISKNFFICPCLLVARQLTVSKHHKFLKVVKNALTGVFSKSTFKN